MGKKSQILAKIANVSYLTELSSKAALKNEKCLKAYRSEVEKRNRLLLNHNYNDVNQAAFNILNHDFNVNLPDDIEKLLLPCSAAAIHKIKDLSSELCYYDALIEEVPTTTVSECVKNFGHYLSKVCLVIAFVLASSALFAQQIPAEWRKPFSEKVSEFWSHSNLCESTILVLFENQLKKDLGITVDFYCGELIMIVKEDLVIPEHWQKSILVVLNDERFIEDNVIKN